MCIRDRIWFIPVVSVSRTIWRVIAVLIAVIYVRLVILQFDSITGSLPEMLKQVEIFTEMCIRDRAWHVVMVEAVHYMEVDWRDSVVKPFNEQLANRCV